MEPEGSKKLKLMDFKQKYLTFLISAFLTFFHREKPVSWPRIQIIKAEFLYPTINGDSCGTRINRQ
jgi:hypothetical protein